MVQFTGSDYFQDIPQNPQADFPYAEELRQFTPLPDVEYLQFQTAESLEHQHFDDTAVTDPSIIDPVLVKYQAPHILVSQAVYFPLGIQGQPALITAGRVLIAGLILNVVTPASATDPFRIWNGRKGGGTPLFDIQATVASTTGPLVISFGSSPIIADQGVVFDPGLTGNASGTFFFQRRAREGRPLQ